MKETLIVQIGNTDNKLTQTEWATFCNELTDLIHRHSEEVHLTGGLSTSSPYQNYVVISTVSPKEIEEIEAHLATLRDKYGQDCIAVTVGETRFI